MYELIKLSENCYYIESPTKVGVLLLGNGEVALIDSGNDKDAGKRILRVLDAQGWTLSAVFNTHYHADHVGGNAYLQSKTGCKLYVPDGELSLVRHPLLESALLYGGNPPAELRHKFLMAQSSAAEPLTEAVLPKGVELIPLSGHSFDMVGFKTAEGVAFIADSVASELTLDKYKVSFLTDVEAYINTLDSLQKAAATCFVPSHAAVTDNIAPLAQLNIKRTLELGDKLVEICNTPLTFEQILRELFDEYDLQMSFEQHALVGSTIKSYLTWLKASGRVTATVADNSILWQRA